MRIYESISELIGGTPLFEPKRLAEKYELSARLLLKLEFFNPAGSSKDRIAREMLDDAESRGLIGPGSTIIEPTSGNTGIGIAAVAASRGYRVIITMPETMSEERKILMRAYGAELVLTEGAKGMRGAIEEAERIRDSVPGSFVAGQFSNPANPAAHEKTTGPEIWRDTDGNVDILVAGIGTGGTVTGAGKYLKGKKQSVRIIGVEPAASPFLSEGRSGAHGIQGIGAGFKPEALDIEVLDGIIPIELKDAYKMCRALVTCEGILVGISSGAALSAAVSLAKKLENEGKVIVAFLPDGGERYLSVPGYIE